MIKNNKGFTLVLALVILVLLSVMLGLFITMVSVNLRHSNRYVAKTLIEQVASDGIEYCNKMLINSPEGADWRPIPENISMKADWVISDVNLGPEPGDVATDFQDIAAKDPDYKWLVPYWPCELKKNGVMYAGPNGGYTRINSGDNRFLVRVTYAPVSKDVSNNKFIANYYDSSAKFIKIESIARKGNVDSDDPTTMMPYEGEQTNSYYLMAYKPIGITDYARFITNKDRQNKTFEIGSGFVTEEYGRTNTKYTKRGGPIRVNGNVAFDDVSIVLRGLDYGGITTPRDLVEITGNISGSSPTYIFVDQDYNSINPPEDDFVKAKQNDESISTLDAPLIDKKIESLNTTRYRQLTKNSGDLISGKGRKGEYGYGDGLYLNNFTDVQEESWKLTGLVALRNDWVNSGYSEYWKGPYYEPPGAVVILSPNGITIQRDDRIGFCTENGVPTASYSKTFDYPKNGVFFAEGNIRIRGMLPADTQLTIVSNENIYIEGNILKNRPNNTNILDAVDTETYKIVDQSSAISLLARKNVVVNTTMFMRPEMSLSTANIKSDFDDNTPPFHIRLNPMEIGSYLQWRFQFGPYESEDELFDGTEWNMAIRHSSDIDFVEAYLEVFNWNNNRWNGIKWGEASSSYYSGVPTYKNKVNGDPNISTISDGGWKYWSYLYRLYDTDFNNNNVGVDQFAKIFLDYNSKGEYILGNVAITPMDVRIEALIYAQNGSFFVIPGYWFETDRAFDNDKLWKFGDPLDIRVIVDGAVSENYSASKSDQLSWMQKWGKTYHPDTTVNGSPIYGKESYHGGKGFTMLYDDTITFPLVGTEPIRYDEYGRVLPITPKLPVSSTLIYKGIVE